MVTPSLRKWRPWGWLLRQVIGALPAGSVVSASPARDGGGDRSTRCEGDWEPALLCLSWVSGPHSLPFIPDSWRLSGSWGPGGAAGPLPPLTGSAGARGHRPFLSLRWPPPSSGLQARLTASPRPARGVRRQPCLRWQTVTDSGPSHLQPPAPLLPRGPDRECRFEFWGASVRVALCSGKHVCAAEGAAQP